MSYSTVLFDLDHTLFDTAASEVAAFEHTMDLAGVHDPGAVFPIYDRINQALWRGVERGETTPNDLRVTRFEQLVSELSLTVDPLVLADAFVDGLGAYGELYDNAFEVLERFAGSANVALITNGLGSVQRARLDRLDIGQFFDAVVISGEVGLSKPAPQIFDRTFDELGVSERAGSIIVGDSLSSDIAGGVNAGIDTCWYNPSGAARGPEGTSGAAISSIKYEFAELSALPELLL